MGQSTLTKQLLLDGLSVFIPTYNSKPHIAEAIRRTYPVVDSLAKTFEIVVVDDHSSDSTPALVKTLQAEYPNLKLIAMQQGPTRRENLAQAMRTASYEIIFFQDVDLSVDPSYLAPLLAQIIAGNDIAIGSRYKEIRPERELWRFCVSLAYNTALRILFSSKLHDHQCGFKAFKKEVLLSLLDDLGYDNTLRRGWFWDAELLIRAQEWGYTIAEMAVTWKSARDSTFNVRREIKMVPYVLKWACFRRAHER